MVKKSSKKNRKGTPATKRADAIFLWIFEWFIKLRMLAKISIFILIVIISVTSSNIYKQENLEKKFFEAEKDLVEIGNDIERKAGLKRGTFIVDKYCYRQSRKFADGPLACVLSLKSDLNNTKSFKHKKYSLNKDEVNLVSQEVRNNDRLYSEESLEKVGLVYDRINLVHKATGLMCNTEIDSETNFYKSGNFSFSIECSHESRRSFYSYRE